MHIPDRNCEDKPSAFGGSVKWQRNSRRGQIIELKATKDTAKRAKTVSFVALRAEPRGGVKAVCDGIEGDLSISH